MSLWTTQVIDRKSEEVDLQKLGCRRSEIQRALNFIIQTFDCEHNYCVYFEYENVC